MEQKKTKEQIDWGFFREIPIWDVIEVLGLETDRKNGLFTCPAHNDTHPSAKVYEDENNWHCFVCKTSGTTIDLVMHANGCNTLEAIHFLNQYFPGGIKEEEIESGTPEMPIIPKEILLAIGFKKSPYAVVRLHDKLAKESFNMELSKVDATMFILSKIDEYTDRTLKFALNIYTTFPELEKNSSAIKEINCRTMNMIEEVRSYIPILENYLLELGTSRRLELAKLEEVKKEEFLSHNKNTIPGRNGNIEYQEQIEHPELSDQFLKAMGLIGDPYGLVRSQCRGKKGLEDVSDTWDIFDNTQLTAEETTTFLLNRIYLYEKKWNNYEKTLYRLYPGLTQNRKAGKEIHRVISDKIAVVQKEKQDLVEFWKTLNDKTIDDTAFDPDDIFKKG